MYDSWLVLIMNFDNRSSLEENTGTVKDISMYNNTGTVYNWAIWTGNGKFDGAYIFNGINNYIGIPYISAYNLTWDMTLSTRFKFNNYTEATSIITNWLFQLFHRWWWAGTGKIYFWYKINEATFLWDSSWTNRWMVKSNTTLQTGIWYHILWTKKWNTLNIYINWILDKTLDCLSWYSIFTWNIWNTTINLWISWYIDDILIYNRALSSWEVTQLYKSTLTKYDTNKRWFSINNSCLIDGTYSYSITATDMNDNQTTTGRLVTIELPDITIGTPLWGLTLPHTNPSTTWQTIEENFSWIDNHFWVNDTKGYTWWYTTIQLSWTLTNNDNSASIPQWNIFFKASDSIDTLEWSPSQNISIAEGITGYKALTGIYNYIIKSYGPDCSSCLLGKYGNLPSLKVNIPSFQTPDTYKTTLVFTIYN